MTRIETGPPPRATRRRNGAGAAPPADQVWTAEGASAVFDHFMAATPAIAFVKDAAGRYLYVNRQFLDRFGDRLGADWFGKTDADIWPPDVAAMVRANDATALAADAPIQVTQRMPVGRARVPILLTKFPIHTARGVLLGGIGLDISEQVRTDDELRRSRALLATAMEIGGISAWEVDRTIRLAAASPGAPRLPGPGAGSTGLTDDPLIRLVHPADRERVLASATEALVEGRPLDTEFRIVDHDGEERWIRATARLVPDETGQSARLVGVSRDVTDERTAMASLRVQAAILANVQDAIVVTDADGLVTYWNEGATRIFGYAPDEMLGRPLSPVYPDAPGRRTRRRGTSSTGRESEGEREATRKDGSTVVVHLRTRLMRGPDGVVTGALGLATDLTERKEHDLERQRLSRAVEQSADAIVITDAEARIQYVNPAFEKSTGYHRDEVLGRNPRILKSGAQSDAYYAAMWGALASGQSWVADMVNRRKDGSLFQEEAVISPIRDASGLITSYVAVKRDVTRERDLEAVAARHAHERALIADTLANLPAQATPEATAQMICRQIVSLTGVVSATLMRFAHDGRALPMGLALADGRSPELRPIPLQRSRHLRERTAQGPWIEAWVNRPWHPYNKMLNESGVRAHGYAPVYHAGTLIGVLAVASAEATAAAGLSERIPALIEFGGIAGALIGPDLVAREGPIQAHLQIVDVIDRLAFRPVFQPIVDLRSDRVMGYEALTRFDDGTAPHEQFAAAEAGGLGLALEAATMREAITAAGGLDAGLLLNLNASPALVLEGKTIRSLVRGVRQSLVLEITEHSAIADYEAFHRAVATLGPSVRLAVDDAGAGFASFRHILELRPDFVKLDRSLVAGIDGDPAKQALVAGMRQFARLTRCRLVAEGVETEDERRTLVGLGIPMAQGYLLGRPGPLPG